MCVCSRMATSVCRHFLWDSSICLVSLCSTVLASSGVSENSLWLAFSIIMISLLCLAFVVGILACIFISTSIESKRRKEIVKKKELQRYLNKQNTVQMPTSIPASTNITKDKEAEEIPETVKESEEWSTNLNNRENLVHRVRGDNN